MPARWRAAPAARPKIGTRPSRERGANTAESVSVTRRPTRCTGTWGTVTNNTNGTFSYNPTASTVFETMANGTSTTDTFTYTVTDNHGVTASATASVVVTITDAGPVAGSASGSTNEDASTTVTVVGAHAEDSLAAVPTSALPTPLKLGTRTHPHKNNIT